mgnify:CR=1 FL=1
MANTATMSQPFLIFFAGTVTGNACAQATFAGANASVVAATADLTGGTANQLWQYGSDNRLYLAGSTSLCIGYVAPTQNAQALILVEMNQGDETQQWTWASGFYLNNVGGSASGTTYVMDLQNGVTTAGTKIQVWQSIANDIDQMWLAVLPVA